MTTRHTIEVKCLGLACEATYLLTKGESPTRYCPGNLEEVEIISLTHKGDELDLSECDGIQQIVEDAIELARYYAVPDDEPQHTNAWRDENR
jgi:hypothetical protein